MKLKQTKILYSCDGCEDALSENGVPIKGLKHLHVKISKIEIAKCVKHIPDDPEKIWRGETVFEDIELQFCNAQCFIKWINANTQKEDEA